MNTVFVVMCSNNGYDKVETVFAYEKKAQDFCDHANIGFGLGWYYVEESSFEE